MFPFWEPVIAPVLRAAGATTVVEIGALRGDNTRRMVEELGPGAVLHVIDPSPGFDPSEQERAFAGRYVFHRALSLDVLGDLPPVDAALIDGDHNWYTVRNELELLRQRARDEDAPLPVLVLHDVCWPYGRRDLYYTPESIPETFRHSYRRAGMRPGRAELLPGRQGLSSGMWNAEVEGGPQNGVMTALEDFVDDHDWPLRIVVLPLYFGLAVVVEERRLDALPGLRDCLDQLESADGLRQMVELGEQLRLRALAHHHTVVARHADRVDGLVARYLDAIERELVSQGGDAERLAAVRAVLPSLVPTDGPGDVALVGVDPPSAALVLAHSVVQGYEGTLWIAASPRCAQELGAFVASLDLPADRVRPLGHDEHTVFPGRLGGLLVAAADDDADAAVEDLGPLLDTARSPIRL